MGIPLEPDEYKVVITGKGEMGQLVDLETGEAKAWFNELLMYNPEDENNEAPMVFGISEMIISGEIQNIERVRFNEMFPVGEAPLYCSLETVIIEDANGIIKAPKDENGEYFQNESIM